MPRLNKDTWAEARHRWESDPAATYASIGKEIGVSHTAVAKQATKNGWAKVGALAQVNERAQLLADRREVAREVAAHEPDKRPAPGSLEDAAQLRSRVIERHRSEWEEVNRFRIAAMVSMKAAFENKDVETQRDEWWKAKIASDTVLHHMRALDTKQIGERRAHGLSDADNAQAIIIERTYGALNE